MPRSSAADLRALLERARAEVDDTFARALALVEELDQAVRVDARTVRDELRALLAQGKTERNAVGELALRYTRTPRRIRQLIALAEEIEALVK